MEYGNRGSHRVRALGAPTVNKDNGKTFNPMNGLPFHNAQRVIAGPADASAIYVTTFGGSG